MNNQNIKYKTRYVRDTINVIIAQLGHRETDQREQDRHHTMANTSYPKGVADRHQVLAHHQAKNSLHTHHLFDPPCVICVVQLYI
jgi:hypothetical protein